MSATQKREPELDARALSLPNDPALGLHPRDTHIALQTDVCKELVNKIAWVLGSTYRVPYANMRTEARQYAWRLARRVLEDHGYPSKIAK